MSSARDHDQSAEKATPQERAPDIRKSDLITLTMVVEHVFPDYLLLLLKTSDVAVEKGGGVRVAVNFNAIVRHEPKALEAGSTVKFAGNPNSITGRILHIIGEHAWVRWHSYDEVQLLSLLEREYRPDRLSTLGAEA